ncbi:DUF188 domain-containing protein [Sporomusa sp.]|uniref:YaiI/YqxD family protein n=1 Tax=Sporomusa sp. TaxID=2078658 RepID=UPI002BD42ABF|nr:DUF188 domain-containing protein [Sporomusa sp.]HWR44212.1 DUF188 domain-containing protein [Sporomusa sp.]
MKILIDADACPKAALQICVQIGHKYDIPIWTVASFNHNIVSDHHVVVGSASQEADIKVINMTEPGDIIVTQDWGLASMVLGKAAYCLSPTGKEYSPENIDFLLEEREIKAKFRRGGGRTKGPSKRTREDDQRFEAGIERLITKEQPQLG